MRVGQSAAVKLDVGHGKVGGVDFGLELTADEVEAIV
jgi:hypothetical protein